MQNIRKSVRAHWDATAAVLVAVALAACSESVALPNTQALIEIQRLDSAVYAGDVVTLRATVRTQNGDEIPGAVVRWSLSDSSVAEVAPNGTLTALKAGNVRVDARAEGVTASLDVPIRALHVLQVLVLPTQLSLALGDVSPVGVRLVGEGGRTVIGHSVTLTSDNPMVATIDASGRVRAVSAGRTSIRATSGGVAGSAQIDVEPNDALLALSRLGGAALPVLTSADSVWTNGVREFHEIYVESGTLRLTGGATPKYELDVRYVEYDVKWVKGARVMEVRYRSREHDWGAVEYDARGDLAMTSDYFSPLSHTASPSSGGMQVRYRIPGSDEYLDLFYRREPR